MARILCLPLPYLGHVNPMLALGRELARRGHAVTLVQIADVAPYAKKAGLEFVSIGATSHPAGWLAASSARLGGANGYLGAGPVVADLASLTEAICRDLPDVVRALSIDLVITDQYEAAGGMVAYHTDRIFVSVAAALPLNWEEGVPSPFVGWRYGESRWHRYRNIASAYGAKVRMSPIGDVIEEYATRWKLGRGRQILAYGSGFAQISQLVRPLDYPRRALIGCFHYCGPLREPARGGDAIPPGPSRRAFASFGSLQGHRVALFERVARAAAANGLDLTIAHGGRLDAAAVARLSRYAQVEGFVVHDEILPGCEVAILHGGLNTILDALGQGVPVVVIPLAFEQGAIASRVSRAGAGLACRPQFLRDGSLGRAIAKVGAQPSFAAAARIMSEAIREAGGTRRAADIVEEVGATGRPCHAAWSGTGVQTSCV